MKFTRNWCNHLKRNLKYITKFKEEPTTYLEIGVFEGGSLQLMLDNILLHPDSKAIGIDPWDIEYQISRGVFGKDENTIKERKQILQDNLNELRQNPKVELIQGYSQNVLRNSRWLNHSIDIVQIDGHHTGMCVLRDFSLIWPLLKPEGILIFDNYHKEVKEAVDVILTFLGARLARRRGRKRISKYERLFVNKQLGIKKLRD